MRNLLRLIGVDVLAPLAAIAALLMIGVMLGWPVWWVSVCSMLCLLIVQAVIVNVIGYRRDLVTVGTDDAAPGLRLAVVAVAATTLVAAAIVGYTHWTVSDHTFERDSVEVVRIASKVSEATATFTPTDPELSIDQATSMMTPESAEAFRAQFAPAAADMAKREVTARAQTISAGLEALGRSAASVAVVLRGTQAAPGGEPSSAVLALRVGLAKQDGDWKVVDVAAIKSQ